MIPAGVPTNPKELIAKANEWIEQCRTSAGSRAAYCRTLNAIAESGKFDGTKALINMMHPGIDRTASHLFSPTELKFSIDFERPAPKVMYERGREVAKAVTRQWERSGLDMAFARATFEALKYGACIVKQWVEMEGTEPNEYPVYHHDLVLPWNFGVYREDKNSLDKQEILCETITLTMPEVWKRIYRMPDADKLYVRILSHAKRGQALADPDSYFHQILSTSQLNTGVQGMVSPIPGGIVQLNDPNYGIMGPVIAAETVQMHELWVKDETDYTTIQLIEPDVLVTPYNNGKIIYRKQNLLADGKHLQGYRLVQPNETTGWFWGRSELVDLMEPQGLLSQWAEDLKRLFGLQVDKILGFVGDTTITDELFAKFRQSGYVNMGPNGKIQDLTPQMPPELLPLLKWLMEIINVTGGFPPILQGQGEPGVRAGSHAQTLLKTASPQLRDRALLVERQCAECADLTARLMQIKDEDFYWTKADKAIEDIESTKFLLTDLPNDWRITVDSHSSSPIFSDENTQMVFAAQARGVVDEEYVIDNTNLPNKEIAKMGLRERRERMQQMLQQFAQQDPEGVRKMMEKQMLGGGGKRR